MRDQKTEMNMQKWLLFVPHSLNVKMRKHIEKLGYESMGSFIRTAIYNQLDREKPITYPLPKMRQKLICFEMPKTIHKEINNSTAKTNYSSMKFSVTQKMFLAHITIAIICFNSLNLITENSPPSLIVMN